MFYVYVNIFKLILRMDRTIIRLNLSNAQDSPVSSMGRENFLQFSALFVVVTIFLSLFLQLLQFLQLLRFLQFLQWRGEKVYTIFSFFDDCDNVYIFFLQFLQLLQLLQFLHFLHLLQFLQLGERKVYTISNLLSCGRRRLTDLAAQINKQKTEDESRREISIGQKQERFQRRGSFQCLPFKFIVRWHIILFLLPIQVPQGIW